MEIQHATEYFERFMIDARDNAHLTTRNQTYTMIQGVLIAFRKRLDYRQAIGFANVLPPVLRAIFVADWNLDEPKQDFEDRAAMTRDVQSLRKDHNFAPDSCIADVAKALRKHVDLAQFERFLEQLPEGAREFWSGR